MAEQVRLDIADRRETDSRYGVRLHYHVGRVDATIYSLHCEAKKIVHRIHLAIKARGLTQSQAADILGIDQPKVSGLIRGRFSGFSMERLFRFLNALDQDVDIVIRPARSARGEAITRVIAGNPV